MWSRRFLVTGLASGTAIAALALAGIWIAIFVAIDEPFANVALFGVPGVIAYPACWYFVIFRTRDYSLPQTMLLVGSTFGAAAAPIVMSMFAATLYFTISMMIHAAQAGRMDTVLITAWTPVGVLIVLLLGIIVVSIPYLLIATPMTFLHRCLLLRFFASQAPPPLPIRSPRPAAI